MTERVLMHSKSRGAARNVLHVLAYHAHKDGTESYPGIGTIVAEANVTRREVFRSLRALRDMGEIKVRVRPKTAMQNEYTLTIAGVCTGDTRSPCKGAKMCAQARTGAADVTLEVSPSHLTGDALSPKGDAATREPYQPSVTPKETSTSEDALRASRRGKNGDGGTTFEKRERVRTPEQEAALTRVREGRVVELRSKYPNASRADINGVASGSYPESALKTGVSPHE
jgi:hypothetical protein